MVDKRFRFDLATLHVLQPRVVVLEIGSNDVCNIGSELVNNRTRNTLETSQAGSTFTWYL